MRKADSTQLLVHGSSISGPQVERVLTECLEARTSASKARWIIRLSEFSTDGGEIPAGTGLGAFLFGPFSDVVGEILGDGAAEDLVVELSSILGVEDSDVWKQPPLHPSYRPVPGEPSRVPTELLPQRLLDGDTARRRTTERRLIRPPTLQMTFVAPPETDTVEAGVRQAPRSRERQITESYLRRLKVTRLHR